MRSCNMSTTANSETMVSTLLSKTRSFCKLVLFIGQQFWNMASAVFKGDPEAAGDHARALYLTVYEDLLSTVVTIQRVLPFWPMPNRNIDRILIVKLDRIGDMVTTTPVFDALREKFPNARLDIVGHPVALSLLEDDERISERMYYRSWLYHASTILPPGPKSIGLILKLLWRRYPLVVFLRGSAPLLVLGIGSRVAATKFIVAEPVVERYLKAIAKVCGPVSCYRPRLHVSAQSADFARTLLRHDDEPEAPVIAIHATASSAAKTWPVDRYAALADQLSERLGARVHFLGSPSERAILGRISDWARLTHTYHCTLKLSQVAAVIAEADLFIGNDSGLAHVAAAVDTRSIVLWGPANLSMARPMAPLDMCVIFYHDLPCRQLCPEVRCNNPNAYECLTRTSVHDVLEAAGQFFHHPAAGSMPLRYGRTISPSESCPSQSMAPLHQTFSLDVSTQSTTAVK